MRSTLRGARAARRQAASVPLRPRDRRHRERPRRPSADADPERERGWIADVGGRPAGSIFCVEFARAAGYRRMVLWTDEFLVPARRLYATAGFRLVSSRTEVAFGHENVAEDWELVL